MGAHIEVIIKTKEGEIVSCRIDELSENTSIEDDVIPLIKGFCIGYGEVLIKDLNYRTEYDLIPLQIAVDEILIESNGLHEKYLGYIEGKFIRIE